MSTEVCEATVSSISSTSTCDKTFQVVPFKTSDSSVQTVNCVVSNKATQSVPDIHSEETQTRTPQNDQISVQTNFELPSNTSQLPKSYNMSLTEYSKLHFPEPENGRDNPQRETETVLKTRMKDHEAEYLIKWKDQPSTKNSWVRGDKLDKAAISYIVENTSKVKGLPTKQLFAEHPWEEEQKYLIAILYGPCTDIEKDAFMIFLDDEGDEIPLYGGDVCQTTRQRFGLKFKT